MWVGRRKTRTASFLTSGTLPIATGAFSWGWLEGLGVLGVTLAGLRSGRETWLVLCGLVAVVLVAWDRLPASLLCVTSHTSKPLAPPPITLLLRPSPYNLPTHRTHIFFVLFATKTARTTSPSPPSTPLTPPSTRASSYCKSKPSPGSEGGREGGREGGKEAWMGVCPAALLVSLSSSYYPTHSPTLLPKHTHKNRHGSRVPYIKYMDCWDGYGFKWDCDVTQMSIPSPNDTGNDGECWRRGGRGEGGMEAQVPSIKILFIPFRPTKTALSAPFIFRKVYDGSPTILGGTCHLGHLVLEGYEQEAANGLALGTAHRNTHPHTHTHTQTKTQPAPPPSSSARSTTAHPPF